jgi:hypothetical protein
MASLKDSGLGIGDFAQMLLEQGSPTPASTPKKKTLPGNVPDIEEVPVSQDQVNSVLAESFGIQEKAGRAATVATDPQNVIKNPEKPERSKKELKEEIAKTVRHLKSLLQEMTVGTTTTGMGGAHNGLGFNAKNPKGRRSSKGR